MAKKTSGLGRGLDSLIPVGLDVAEVASPGESVKNIKLDKLVVNPDQPRKHFDEEALKGLAASIKQHGIIQPIVATPQEDNYRIVAGERRYRAATLAGLDEVPVIIRDHEELEELEIALVENVQRVDLSPLEQAVSIVRLHEQFSMSFKEIARKLGKAETTVSNIVRLLQLPKEAIEAMQKNRISEGHARAILALKTDKKQQKELLNTIIAQKLSVRQAEAYVQSLKNDSKVDTISAPKTAISIVQSLTATDQKRIKLQPKTKTSGTVKITYTSNKELESILRQIGK